MNETISIDGLKYSEIDIIDILDSNNETMDIEVENDHYYTLNNGIVSHNTVSIMTQTTSGIEPVFLPVYTRRRKINPNDKSVKVSFIDEVGDHWEEYNVFHPKFKIWAEINGYDTEELEYLKEEELQEIVKLSPYYGATSNNVDWLEKVKMQGRIQKWVDHSISCCLTKDMMVDTDEGLFYLDELCDFNNINVGEFIDNDTFKGLVLNHNLKRTKITSFLQ